MSRRHLSGFLATALALCLASGPASALTISVTPTDSTTDNDFYADESKGNAASGSQTLSSDPVVVANAVGSTGTSQVRFYGFDAEGGSYGLITQNINIKATFTVTPDDASQVYSIAFHPEFHGLMKITDPGAPQSNDSASIGPMSGLLKVDGTGVAALNLGTGTTTLSAHGAQDVDRTAAHTLTGLSGTHTFELRYTGLMGAVGNGSGGVPDPCENISSSAVLWGQDGTVSGFPCSAINSNDNYPSAAVRDADGFFLPATVTITAVPEPGTLLLLVSGMTGLGACGRKRA